MPSFDEEGLDFISSCRTQMELCNAHPNQRLSGDQQMEMLVDLCGVRPRWWAKVCRIKTICSLFFVCLSIAFVLSRCEREALILVSSPLFAPLNHPSIFILKTDGSSERHLKLSFPFFFFSFFSFPDPSTPRLSCFCSYLNPQVRRLQRAHTKCTRLLLNKSVMCQSRCQTACTCRLAVDAAQIAHRR